MVQFISQAPVKLSPLVVVIGLLILPVLLALMLVFVVVGVISALVLGLVGRIRGKPAGQSFAYQAMRRYTSPRQAHEASDQHQVMPPSRIIDAEFEVIDTDKRN